MTGTPQDRELLRLAKAVIAAANHDEMLDLAIARLPDALCALSEYLVKLGELKLRTEP